MQRRPSCMGGPFGWGASRQTTLLAASILSSCFLLTEGQGTITPVKIVLQPPRPAEGQEVTLTPNAGDLVGKAENCRWYRSTTFDEKKRIFTYYLSPPPQEQRNGPAFTGRESGGPGCSLLIRNLTSEDTGNYTVVLEGREIATTTASASVFVSEKLTSPVLWPSDVLVAEKSNVTLNCTTSNNVDVSVSWFKDGKPLLAVAGLLGLSDRNRMLTLIRVTRNDAGLYACEASNPVSSVKSNSAKITVAYGPEEIKLNPEGTVEKSLNSYLKLECTAVSIPAAQFQWYFNNSEILNATKSIFQVCLSNWTDEGNYTCQATNPFTLRRAMRTAYVKLTKARDPPAALGAGTIAGIVIGSLAVTALIVGSLLYVFLRRLDRGDKKSTQTVAAPSIYENVSPSTQVKTDSPPNSNHVYETLQHADQSVYQQLEGCRKVSQPVSLS